MLIAGVRRQIVHGLITAVASVWGCGYRSRSLEPVRRCDRLAHGTDPADRIAGQPHAHGTRTRHRSAGVGAGSDRAAGHYDDWFLRNIDKGLAEVERGQT